MGKKIKKESKKDASVVSGILSITGKGLGFVRVQGEKENIEIDPTFLNTGLHDDQVRVRISGKTRDGKRNGEIVEIVSRSKAGFSGTIEKEGGIYFLVPADQKMYTDILIPEEMLNGAEIGQKVFVVISEWKDQKKAPIGKVVEILGQPGEHDAEMKGIALEKGFTAKFPSEVEREAEKLKKLEVDEEETKKRRDFRKITTFTIDPFDAKDFDDAISIQELSGGNLEIGIHIADVSHYVKPDTELDKEAIKRSTSLYLVDRTIPMLPEILSNDLCSLNPEEDKFTMSAVFELTRDAKVVKEWFGKTIIHSNKRFTYEEAQEILDKKTGVFYRELNILN
ncbi:MAG: RNB domain-containing ribonuclease, partial [Patescibacteria group bacterium]